MQCEHDAFGEGLQALVHRRGDTTKCNFKTSVFQRKTVIKLDNVNIDEAGRNEQKQLDQNIHVQSIVADRNRN